jgi:hypothetical protein
VTELWSLYGFLQQSKSYRAAAAAAHTMQIRVIKTLEGGRVQGLTFISLNPKWIGWAKTREFCLVKARWHLIHTGFWTLKGLAVYNLVFFASHIHPGFGFGIYNIMLCIEKYCWFGEGPEVTDTGYA